MSDFNKRIDNVTCLYVILLGLFFLGMGAISDFNFQVIGVACVMLALGIGQLIYNTIRYKKEHRR